MTRRVVLSVCVLECGNGYVRNCGQCHVEPFSHSLCTSGSAAIRLFAERVMQHQQEMSFQSSQTKTTRHVAYCCSLRSQQNVTLLKCRIVFQSCRYSKLEAAKMQAVSELEEEYGAPIDEIVEYVDDDGEVHRSSREYEAADEEAMLDGNPVSGIYSGCFICSIVELNNRMWAASSVPSYS